MSEYQYVGFRAIDAPVSEKNLEFIRRQSSRAEITPWSFDNEYHFGDFRGNAAEMLRRGYDFHLHYANYGTRNLMIRLPEGLPSPEASEKYLEKDGLSFLNDKQGRGGILCITPYIEAGELDDLWGVAPFLDRLLPLRAEILDGDLRPLYLSRLAVACDGNHDPDAEEDAPVPAGLDTLSDAQKALAEFYGLDEPLIAAAAQNCPSLPERKDPKSRYTAWLRKQPEAMKTAWLAELMTDPHSAVRRKALAEFQKTQVAHAWPTVRIHRTIAELEAAAEVIGREIERENAEKTARARAKKLADIASDPVRVVKETEQLIKQRTTEAYRQIAILLADLREAQAGREQSGLAEQQARKLKKENPKLHFLTAALRDRGFVPK